MRRFNTKLFLWLLGITLGVAGVACLVHYLQTGRIAQALLWQARRAEEHGDVKEAVRYLGRYVEFAPKDLDERSHLGTILAHQVLEADPAKPPSYRTRERALFVLEGVVAADPGRQDARRLLARVAMNLDRVDRAQEHLAELHRQLPDDGEVACLLAECQEAQGNFAEAALLCWESIRHAPKHRDGYVRLALLLRRPDHKTWHVVKDPDGVLKKKPEEILNLLVAANGDAYQAHLARWAAHDREQLKDKKKRAEAAKDVEQALRLAPQEADVLLAAAELARLSDDLTGARARLRKCRELHPTEKRAYLALAAVELADGKPGEAVARLNEGLEALPEQPDLLWLLANVRLDNREWDAASRAIERMRKAGGPATGVDYLQARALVGQGRWPEAARALENTRPIMERDGAAPGLLDQVDVYLAVCYEQMDEPAQRLAAFERIISRAVRRGGAPETVNAALRGRGDVLWVLGRQDEAITQYQELLGRPDAPKAAWTELARLLIARTLLRGQTDWREAEFVLQRAAKEQPDAVDVPLLQARLHLIRREWDQARAVLREAQRRFPKHQEPWAALIELAELREQPAEVVRLIGEAEAKTGDSVDVRLAKARAWAADVRKREEPPPKGKPAGDAGAAPFPPALSVGLEKFTPDDQTRLLRGLMDAAYGAGRTAEALRLWQRLSALPQHEHDPRIQLVTVELAIQAEDDAAVARALDEVRRIEGGPGPLWSYGEGLRLMRRGEKAKDPAALARAAELLDAAAAQRPAWAALRLALADLEKVRGNPDAAIAQYQKALALNERSPRTYRALAQLLSERGRMAEADEVLRKMPAPALAAGDLQWLAIDLALRNHDPARATQLAVGAVPRDSSDYRDFLRRGTVLAAARRWEDGERDLRHAAELAPDRAETWLALVRLLAASGQAEEARKVTESARTKLPVDVLALTLAGCYEAVGDAKTAQEQYARALEKKPADYDVRATAVTFYLRANEPAEAEALLRPMAAGRPKLTDSQTTWARHQLAVLLAGYPDEPHFAEALGLVGLRLDGDKVVADRAPAGDTAEARREEAHIRAQVLASRPRHACRAEAISALEGIRAGGPLAADDQFLLAQLYEAEGNTARARELLLSLTAGQGDNPAALAYYARLLLSQRETAEAQRCVEQLVALEKGRGAAPGAYGSVELEARVYETRGEGKRALDLLESYVRRPGARPEEIALLIESLTRQKQYDAALDACEQAWRTCPAPVAGRVTLAVLHAMKPTADQFARLEAHLKEAHAKEPEQARLLLLQAGLCDLREDYAGATRWYREALALDGGNWVALNNLAWLLAQTSGDKAEALRLVQQAIERQGTRAELLDTRAVVELALSQTDAAIRDLRQANADQPNGTRYFRLARAYCQARDRDAARAAMRRAKSSGLRPEQLHPTEQTAFREVSRELDAQ
jgi:tetratricopeptide (TPR) repeat protein